MKHINTMTWSLVLIMMTLSKPVAAADEKAEIMEPHVMPDNMNAMFERGILHGRVEAALLFNENLDSFDINTKIQKHKAVLTGYVNTELEKELATYVALNVEGIREVDNNIIVADEKSLKENLENIREEIQDVANEARIITALESSYAVNAHLSGLGINVNADGSKVILTGTVISDVHKDLAEFVAFNTEGVTNVDNRLRVEPES